MKRLLTTIVGCLCLTGFGAVPQSAGTAAVRPVAAVIPAPAGPKMVTYEEQAVAAVLMGEAWSDGLSGMTAVADVIHQRAVEKHQTPLEVISVHHGRVHAFSCLNGSSTDKLIEKFSHEPDYQRALRIAEITCETPSQLPGLVRFATHYTRRSERPYWAHGLHPVAVIGRHVFYRLQEY